MAKVVILWGEHPNEAIGAVHAKAVAKLLATPEYGEHEVILEKVPYDKTNHGIVTSNETPAEKVRRLLYVKPSHSLASDYVDVHDCHVFNFHSSDYEVQGESDKREPHQFRIGHYKRGTLGHLRSKTEIDIIQGSNPRAHLVEVPGFYEGIDPDKHEEYAAKREEVAREFIAQGHKPAPWNTDLILPFYFLQRAPLNHSEQQKFLSPHIPAMIARAIHEKITEKRTE